MPQIGNNTFYGQESAKPVSGSTGTFYASTDAGKFYLYDNNKLPVLIGSTGFTAGNDYVTGSTFNTSDGILTSTRVSGATFTVDLDGRYALTGHTHTVSDITDFTDNSTNWNIAYDDNITGITVTGTVEKTINLFQRDGSTLTADFTDNSGSGGGSGDVVTGMTFSTSDGVLSLNTLSGNTITEDLDGRYLTGYTETDPIFTSSPASNITSTDITNLGNLSGVNTGDQDLSPYLAGSGTTNTIAKFTPDGKTLGDSTLVSNANGNYNIGVGNSTFFGLGAGLNDDGTNNGNAFYATNSGRNNTSGTNNSFFGVVSGYFNTTGYFNSFFGYDSGYNNTTGNQNVFFGSSAGYSNETGGLNTFFGHAAGFDNVGGFSNAFFGNASGESNTASNNSFFGGSSGNLNTTGTSNAFFGYQSGFRNTTANGNSYFGFNAGRENQTGGGNSFFGYNSGRYTATNSTITTVNNSTFIGYNTRANADNETNQIIIGYGAIGDGSNTTVIGNTGTTSTKLFGILKTPEYGTGTVTGTTAYGAAFDANGKLIEVALAGGGTVPTGLEALDEGNGIGWRLIGRDPANFGNIGSNAVDLSYSNTTSTTYGATGLRSFAVGSINTASGSYSVAIGNQNTSAAGYSITLGLSNSINSNATNSFALGTNNTVTQSTQGAIGDQNTINGGTNNYTLGRINTVNSNTSGIAIGANNIVDGNYAIAIGRGLSTQSIGEIQMGYYATEYSEGSNGEFTFNLTDRIFTIGNGTSTTSRSDALRILKNGKTTLPQYGSGTFTGTTTYGAAFDANGNLIEVPLAGGGVLSGSGTVNRIPKFTPDGTTLGDSPFVVDADGIYNVNIGSNVFFGFGAGINSDNNSSNTYVGNQTGTNSTFGNNNAYYGNYSGFNTTSGSYNSFYGSTSGLNTTSGEGNSFFGAFAGESNTTANANSYFGSGAGANNSTGSNNSFFGGSAGTQDSSGGTLTGADNSIFIGRNTKANANNETNQIVIGYEAIGDGSNTTVIGNSSIISTKLFGTLTIPEYGTGTVTGTTAYGAAFDANGKLIEVNLAGGGTVPTGLEALDEGNGTGWRLIGRDPANYGNIGSNAVDFSYSSSASSTRGATGTQSFAAVGQNTASGANSIALGGSTASGNNSVAIGSGNSSNGNFAIALGKNNFISTGGTESFALGLGHIVQQTRQGAIGFSNTIEGGLFNYAFGSSNVINSDNNGMAIGANHTVDGNWAMAIGRGLLPQSLGEIQMGYYATTYAEAANGETTFNPTDRIFTIGNGTSTSSRSDALRILKNGKTTLPQYGSGTFTGTTAYGLGVDVSGNIVETTAGPSGIEQMTMTITDPNYQSGDVIEFLPAANGFSYFVVSAFIRAEYTSTQATNSEIDLGFPGVNVSTLFIGGSSSQRVSQANTAFGVDGINIENSALLGEITVDINVTGTLKITLLYYKQSNI